MSSRKRKRLREEAARLADPFSLPEEPQVADPVAEALATQETAAPAGPFCVYCGSGLLRESPRRGLRERWLGLGRSTVYRCEDCGSRLAVASLPPGQRKDELRRDLRRRRRATLWVTAAAALLTFLTVAWLIHRAEQRRLEVEGVQPVP
jgi:hypothetical protein